MKIGLEHSKKQAIVEAIKRNEEKTSGEIYCVIARKSDDYRWVLMIWAAILAILIPLILTVLGINLGLMIDNLFGGWNNFNNEAINSHNLYADLTIQAIIFVIAGVLAQNNMVVTALTPQFIKRQGVHKFALDQFLAHGMHQTEEKTGVLIYVSLAEHMIEVVADHGIHSKVDKNIWGDAVAKILAKTKLGDLGGGLVEGIDTIGNVLSQHFPPSKDNPNEISDSVVFI